MSPKLQAFLYVFAANLVWASVGFLVRHAENASGPFLLIAGLSGVVITLTIVTLKGQLNRFRLADFLNPSMIIYGLANGLIGLSIFAAFSDENIFVVVPNLILNSQALLVVLLAPLMLKETTTRSELKYVALGFAGLVLFVFGQAQLSQDGGGSLFSIGLLFALLALLANGFSTVLNRKLTGEAFQWSIVLSVGIADTLVGGTHTLLTGQNPLTLQPYDQLAAVIVGATSITLAYFLIIQGYKQLKAQTVSILGLMQPVMTAVIGIFLLGENPSLLMLAGGAIVLAAVLGTIQSKRRKTG